MDRLPEEPANRERDGRIRSGAGTAGPRPWVSCADSTAGLTRPSELYSSIFVPLAVLAFAASRHNPDCTPVMVPLELTFHCWFGCPLQLQMITAVPLLVPLPLASRHMLPYTCSCLPEVYVHDWFA